MLWLRSGPDAELVVSAEDFSMEYNASGAPSADWVEAGTALCLYIAVSGPNVTARDGFSVEFNSSKLARPHRGMADDRARSSRDVALHR